MKNNLIRLLIISEFMAYALSACKTSPVDLVSTKEETITPIYITVVGHIEDVPVYADCDKYKKYRDKLLGFADAISKTEIAFNLQVEYEFLVGVSRCETEDMKKSTNGQNVIEYLVSCYDFEIDAHQEGGVEEGQDNYADIQYFGETVTPKY